MIEVALAIAYTMIDTFPQDPLSSPLSKEQQKECTLACISPLLSGYLSSFPLTSVELEALPTLCLSRIAQSVTLSTYSFSQNPDNTYLLDSVARGTAVLRLLLDPLVEQEYKAAFTQ